jgi:hypothetical protein
MKHKIQQWEIVFFPGMFLIVLMLFFDWVNYVFTQDVNACIQRFCGLRLPMTVGVGFVTFGLWAREFYRGKREA